MKTGKDVYTIVTEKMIAQLEAGTVPWRKPWRSEHGEVPMNLRSMKAYRGINVWMLGTLGYARPYFVSFKQAKDMGGSVRKGEKGHIAIFWKLNPYKKTVTDATGHDTIEERKGMLLRYYQVFNVAQCDGLEKYLPALAVPPSPAERIDAAEQIARAYHRGPVVQTGALACYRTALDQVTMPARGAFDNPAEYYSTLFHELTHSTGHADRLNRASVADCTSFFGSPDYSREELVAELGAAFLCASAGIENIQAFQNSAAYLAHWLKNLKADARLIVQAAASAQKASDFIKNIRHEDKAAPASTSGAESQAEELATV